VARGAILALATLTKFAPALLVPMLLNYKPWAGRSGRLRFCAAFAFVTIMLLAWPAIDPGLSTMWDRTIGYQAGRDSPFSIWGQMPSLEFVRIAILALTAALAVFCALRPRRKSLVQVTALGAALLIALQLTMHHWFYLYIVWFYPLLLLAMATVSPTSSAKEPEPSPELSSQPVPAG